MTYTVPPPKASPKPRYVEVTDPGEIAAIQRAGLSDPIGECREGRWYATVHSIRQYRGEPVEFDPTTA